MGALGGLFLLFKGLPLFLGRATMRLEEYSKSMEHCLQALGTDIGFVNEDEY